MKWEEHFKIVRKENCGLDFSDWNDEYELVLISTGEVVGKYKDETYARKQAKYKFKKISKQVEKILLG